ncbi:MAG: hypothetical protein HY340_02050 [Candidatus Kerfeldbacteria bacterium]|nr:hypothetical protein [Candidatus Kerfeldbacteria bacterium]
MYIANPEPLAALTWAFWFIVTTAFLSWLMSRSRKIPFSWGVFHTLVLIGASYLFRALVPSKPLGLLFFFLLMSVYWIYILPRIHRRRRDGSGTNGTST